MRLFGTNRFWLRGSSGKSKVHIFQFQPHVECKYNMLIIHNFTCKRGMPTTATFDAKQAQVNDEIERVC